MEHAHEQAFLTAFDEHADALFRHASLRVKGREKAVDLTQETFVKAWDYVRAGNEIRHWKSFLFRTLHNLIVDEYRRAKEYSLDALLDDEDSFGAQELIAEGSRAEREATLDQTLLMEHVRSAIDELPEQQRIAVTLRYLDGLGPKEIAEVLSVSENVVSVRIHRGVAALKERCAPLQDI